MKSFESLFELLFVCALNIVIHLSSCWCVTGLFRSIDEFFRQCLFCIVVQKRQFLS
jgi:hypothetical protein